MTGIAWGDAPNVPTGEFTSDLARGFGVPLHVGAERADWTETTASGGSYIVFAPGQLARFGPQLRRPHGRVFFAGAERSSWPNSMEGALESGEEVAQTVLAYLRPPGCGRGASPP